MFKTVEAFIDAEGNVRLLEGEPLPAGHRAPVTVLGEAPAFRANEITLLSEAVLAEDWNRTEEDEAWSYLQPGK